MTTATRPVEWWERLGAAAARWKAGHPEAAARLARAKVIGLWASLAWILVLLVWRPEIRESAKVSLQVYWLLIAWFWLGRTKTVSWRFLAGLYAVCIPWSLAVAFITHRLSTGALGPGRDVSDFGAFTMMAGLGEESAKLLPVALLALLAAGRVRRFGAVDWLLCGFAAGLAFQLSEELARRTAVHLVRPGLLDILTGALTNRGPDSGFSQYGWSPFGGWSNWAPGTQFPGHHATTALVTAGVGLGVAAWRRGSVRARAGAVALPLVLFWLVVSVHAGGNASSSTGSAWLDTAHPSVPWLVRLGWTVANHGVGLRWLLVLLLLIGLVVDARRLRRVDAEGPVLAVPFIPAARAEGWSRHVAPGWRPLVGPVLLAAAYIGRDVLLLLQAHVPEPGESRWAAIARGRAAMRLTSQARAEGLTVPGGRNPARAVAALAVLALLLCLLWWAPELVHRVGDSPSAGSQWFARLLDALGAWWNGLSPGGKIAVGLGIAALVALSGGSFGLALGVSGAGTYVLGHSAGAATFVRDPAAATRSYLAHTSPLGVAADGTEALLTFAPGNFMGAMGGTVVRNGVRQYLRDPEAWWAAQRAIRGDERGVIDLAAFFRRDPITLADGTSWAARTPEETAAMRRWLDSLPQRPNVARDEAGVYQNRLYGNVEHDVGEAKPTWTDGTTPDYGAVADAKYRLKEESFYDPASLHPSVRRIAEMDLDKRLIKYARVIRADNPARVLELSTNDPRVAVYLEERLRALGIPGYVRLEP